MKERKERQFDPLGLVKLGDTIADLRDDTPTHRAVSTAYQLVMSRYTALQDRYRLLKSANRQLAEEVAWLRDQCDDFALEAGMEDEPARAPEPGREF